MSMLYPIITCTMLATLITGCGREMDRPKTVASDSASKSTDQSVALPPNAVPPSDAAIKPAVPANAAGTSGAAGNTTQANPKEMGKQQEATAMPLPGQANDHSNLKSTDKKQ
jgi:predicted lipid-binding transport protein (Tim44 family)